MLSPEYLSDVPTSMVSLYEEVEKDILSDMARKINEYDYWIPAAEHQATVLEEMGIVREEIIEKLAAKTTLSQTELKKLMKESAWYALESDDAVYERAGLSPSPIAASKELQSVLSAGYKKTSALFQNLTNTTAIAGSKQFQNALDKAYMQITMGGMDYNTAIRNAIKELSKDGLGAVTYASGKVDSLEVAVRRATITGVNQTALQLQEARAEEMGCDLVEVSAHAGARLEHAMWQGEVYSRSGISKKYKGLVEATGYGTGAGLGGWNCSHGFSPYFEGSPRAYSKEQLEDYKAKNYTYNGKAMTEYEALQEQRNIERNIRKWKREQVAMEAAGQSIDDTAVKLKAWQAREDDFLKQTGLKKASDRTSVGGYGKSQATKATNAAKKAALQKEKQDVIIKLQDELEIKGKLSINPSKMDLSEFLFDDVHINGERSHGMTREDAVGFMENALFSLTRYNGNSINFYSLDGAVYVRKDLNAIRTAFYADEYDDKIKELIGEVRKL